jgi:hypothetical protein
MQQSLFPTCTAHSGAVIVGNYRYTLWRIWDSALPWAVFIMLNPSTADAMQDDATLRRCVHFARSWGCGSVEVVNLYAFRSTNPDKLVEIVDPIGPENTAYLQQAIARSHILICAWGTHKAVGKRDEELLQLLEGKEVYCLGSTKNGMPRHPLYVSTATSLRRYP